jgi:hypothetical protein
MQDFFKPFPPVKRKKIGCYANQFFYDRVNRFFYLKTIPDLAIPEDEFNSRYYLFTTPEDERDDDDPASVIKSLRHNALDGRIFEPDNPQNVVIRDGKRLVNARQSYYSARDIRESRKKAA